MENVLNPQIALRTCNNTCSISSLYDRLNKAIGRLRGENLAKLLDMGGR